MSLCSDNSTTAGKERKSQKGATHHQREPSLAPTSGWSRCMLASAIRELRSFGESSHSLPQTSAVWTPRCIETQLVGGGTHGEKLIVTVYQSSSCVPSSTSTSRPPSSNSSSSSVHSRRPSNTTRSTSSTSYVSFQSPNQ